MHDRLAHARPNVVTFDSHGFPLRNLTQRVVPSDLSPTWEPAPAARLNDGNNIKEARMGWFSPEMQTMNDLFLHTMQDIYYAEHQIEKALPDMVEKASDAELKKGFRTHLKQTKGQIKRLNQAFKKLKVRPEGTKCPAIDGIIDEANEIAGEIDDKMVLNAALIAAAQAVEHYEITRYGTLVAWAKLLGRNDVAKVLNMNLKEEKATDKKLNVIAKRKINRKAAARHRKRPDAVERAENGMMVAASRIPAI
jgi:ferritin-like metal-binding protein YciE